MFTDLLMNSRAAPETNYVSRPNIPPNLIKTLDANQQTGAESSYQHISQYKVLHLIKF